MRASTPAPAAPSASSSSGPRIGEDATRPRGIGTVHQAVSRATLVEGSSFCVSGPDGDMGDRGSDGLFVMDTRVISRWELLVDGNRLEALAMLPREPYECVFVSRAPTRPGQVEPTIVVERHRFVGRGMREDVTIHNFGAETAGLDVMLRVEADFANLFEVKENRPATARHTVGQRNVGGDLICWTDGGLVQRGVRVSARGALSSPGALSFRAIVAPQGSWSATIEALPSVQGREIEADFPTDRPVETAEPARRMQGWRESVPRIAVENTVLSHALEVSRQDLGALRISDPERPGDDVVAAGAPWFMTLFGRDSLITSWMMLPFSPWLAMGTLRTLARHQGTREDPLSEEQPGRILHEVRLGVDPGDALGGSGIYYGSIDATPLFIMLAGRALRWGVPADELLHLRTPVERALDWIERFGDRDGDGFVEYQRSTDRGLANQGWKDSQDSIVFHDGRQARAPIALAEVQGYCYAALRAGAQLEESWGDRDAAMRLRTRADQLRRAFHHAYWNADRGFYAMALDADKKQVDSISSNIGHCLWTGIVADSVTDAVVERLVAPDMFTGFGVRTLSAGSAAFNPASYHDGSVWPHDTVIAAAGMAAHGHREEALRVISGLLDALEAFGGRLPELFCGFDRAQKPTPIPYPTSCSPQAWAAATPFEMLRIGLDLRSDLPHRMFTATEPPSVLGRVDIDGLPLGAQRIHVDAGAAGVHLTGLPDGIQGRTRDSGSAPVGDGPSVDAGAPVGAGSRAVAADGARR